MIPATPEELAELQQLEEQYVQELNLAIKSAYKDQLLVLLTTAMKSGWTPAQVLQSMEEAKYFVDEQAPPPPEALPELPQEDSPAAPPPYEAPTEEPTSRKGDYMAAAQRNMA